MYYCKDRDFINWLLDIKLNNERTISKANIRCLANKEQKKDCNTIFAAFLRIKEKNLTTTCSISLFSQVAEEGSKKILCQRPIRTINTIFYLGSLNFTLYQPCILQFF